MNGISTKGYQSSKQYTQEELLDFVKIGDQEYKGALRFWGKDVSLYDSLLKDIKMGNIVAQSLSEEDWANVDVPDWDGFKPSNDNLFGFFKSRKYHPDEVKKGSPDSVFVRKEVRNIRVPPMTEKEVLAHELAHYFTPHLPKPLHLFPWEYFMEKSKGRDKAKEMSYKTRSLMFNKLFNPVAEKYADKQLSDLKERARIMEEAGYKLPEGLQQGGQESLWDRLMEARESPSIKESPFLPGYSRY